MDGVLDPVRELLGKMCWVEVGHREWSVWSWNCEIAVVEDVFELVPDCRQVWFLHVLCLAPQCVEVSISGVVAAQVLACVKTL